MDHAVQDGQLALPIFEPLVNHGLQQIHVRPWVGDEEKIRRGRRPAPEAWDNWPYVETHPAHTYAGLFFDIDKPELWEYEVDGPCPNWQIRKDGLQPTYHVAYMSLFRIYRPVNWEFFRIYPPDFQGH